MKALVYLIVLLLCLQTQAEGQTHQRLDFTVPLKERRIVAHEVVNIILKINNRQNTKSNAWIKVVSDKALQLVSKEIIPLALNPGDSLFIPVKIFVPENTSSGRDYTVNFQLEDQTGVLHSESCKLMLAAQRSVTLHPRVSSIVLTSVSDSITIPVQISNKGNNDQKINVLARFPSNIQGSGFHNSLQLNMRAFSDTTVYIRKRVTREMLSQDAFSVLISGIYLNGDLFTQTAVDIQTLKSVRYNYVPSELDQYLKSYDNSISLSSQNFGSSFASYQVTGGGAVDLPFSRIGYHIDAQFFRNFPDQPYITNTYLSYETRKMGLSVGNISRNLDVNMNGRGATVYFTDSSRKNHYEAGYIDNSANLIRFNQFAMGDGRSAWGKYEFKGKVFQLISTAIYNKDPFVRAQNLLLGNDLFIKLKNFQISASMNGGQSSEIHNPSNAKLGFLGAFSLDGMVGKFNINSNNLISTAYYPGIRKGSVIFSERITYSNAGANIWAGLNYFSNNPKFVSSYLVSVNDNWSSKAEIGVSKVFNRLSLSIAPTFQKGYGKYVLSANQAVSATIQSWRAVSQASYSTTKHSVFLGIEAGVVNNSLNHIPGLQVKVNGSFRYGTFGLNTNLQYGSFYVNDILNAHLLNTGNSYSYSVTPTFYSNFLGGKARTETGISYNKNSISGSTITLTARGEYNLSSKTRVFSGLVRNEYNFGLYKQQFNNLQFGITQKIPSARVGSKNSQLEVVLYKDENQNGRRDKGDIEAKDQLVYINGTAFITTGDGKITYKNLKDGNYTVSVISNDQWYAPDQRITLNKKNVRLEIPLSKTGTVKGSILYVYNDFSYEVNKQRSGVTIRAIDANGAVTKTKTDDGGRFNFYLPTGIYTLAVDMSELPEQVSCKNNDKLLTITPEKAENIKFELAVLQRKIETKKFMSTKDRDREREREREREKEKEK